MPFVGGDLLWAGGGNEFYSGQQPGQPHCIGSASFKFVGQKERLVFVV